VAPDELRRFRRVAVDLANVAEIELRGPVATAADRQVLDAVFRHAVGLERSITTLLGERQVDRRLVARPR
jgi:hypothetical protein